MKHVARSFLHFMVGKFYKVLPLVKQKKIITGYRNQGVQILRVRFCQYKQIYIRTNRLIMSRSPLASYTVSLKVPFLVFSSVIIMLEKVLYCFYKIILKNTRESKTSQPCLRTLV